MAGCNVIDSVAAILRLKLEPEIRVRARSNCEFPLIPRRNYQLLERSTFKSGAINRDNRIFVVTERRGVGIRLL